MNRFLTLQPTERAQAFEQAGARRGLPSGSIAKDFWVCLTLRELFALPEFSNRLTFKGGTSLSKAWGLIDRFSEDIDLTIDREFLGFGGDRGPESAKSGNEQDRRLRAVKQACREAISARLAPALTARLQQVLTDDSWSLSADKDDPDGQTLLFEYPRAADNSPVPYVRPAVKLEFGARSDPWPAEHRRVTPIVADVFGPLFDQPACTVNALRPERTFWEKVMLLHEERLRPAGRQHRPRMARHYYDVWRLIESGVAAKAAVDTNLFDLVVAHREVFFNQRWVTYKGLKQSAIDSLPKDHQMDEWRQDYVAMRADMFADTPPPFEELLAAIRTFQQGLKQA